jgi:HEPN domain-containing protein
MKKNNKDLVKEWFIKGHQDIESAQLLLKEHGHLETIAFLIQQSIEKYIKGYLIFNKWELKKIHDLQELINEAFKIDKSFEEFLDPCIKISKYYLDTRYPGLPTEYSKKEIEESFEVAKNLIEKIRKSIK